jgi:hypothetical protein
MKVAVTPCGENQRLFEMFSLSANLVAEFVNHLLGKSQIQIKNYTNFVEHLVANDIRVMHVKFTFCICIW